MVLGVYYLTMARRLATRAMAASSPTWTKSIWPTRWARWTCTPRSSCCADTWYDEQERPAARSRDRALIETTVGPRALQPHPAGRDALRQRSARQGRREGPGRRSATSCAARSRPPNWWPTRSRTSASSMPRAPAPRSPCRTSPSRRSEGQDHRRGPEARSK